MTNNALHNIAAQLRYQKKPDDAIQVLDKRIEICNRLLQLAFLDMNVLVVTLNVLARCLKETTIEALNQVLMIKKKTLGKCTVKQETPMQILH